MIIDYQVVEAVTTTILEKKVKDEMALGWQPLGPATVLREGSSNLFVQTLVKYQP